MRASAGAIPWIGAIFAVLLAMLPALPRAQAPAGKVGYVDMKRLIDNAPQMNASRERLQREFAPRDAALKDDETRLKALQARYARDAAIMSASDAETLKREVDTLERSVKRNREALRSELNARAGADRDRIWQQINETVIEYARAHGYDLVVPSPVVYASPRVDLTDAVLDALRHAKPASP